MATAIVVGVGPEAGLGGALCKRFAREGLHVLVAGRTREKVESVATSILGAGGRATAVPTDATREPDVVRLFDEATRLGEPLDLVVYNAGNAAMGEIRDMEAGYFEQVWRIGCFGGFLVGREAVRRLLPSGRGTVIFTGATASLRGRPATVAFASAKAGLRAIAQSMARAYGPQGIHVAHVVIDGAIGGEKIVQGLPQVAQHLGADGMLSLEGIADAYWFLHTQPKTTWTHELDLRPYKESF